MSRLPLYGKPDSFFSHLSGTGQVSGHETTIVAKLRKERERNKPFRWVFKKFSNPLLAEIEAGVAACYYLIAPEHNPKIRVVYDTAGKAIGTVSKLFPNYMSLREYLGDHFGVAGFEIETQKKLNRLIENGLAEVQTLSYFFEEDDLHLENIGVLCQKKGDEFVVDEEGFFIVEKVVRIDYDMSAYTIVAQEALRGDRTGYGRKPLTERFLLTDRDLTTLPCVEDADPWYCSTIYRASMDIPLARVSHAYTKEQVQIFRTLSQHPSYSAKKFLTLLKITLFNDDTFISRLSAHVDDPASLSQLKKFTAKKNALKEMLPKNAKFQSACEESLEDPFLESIWREGIRSFIVGIAEYNQHLKPKHQSLFVDVELLKNEYYTLCCVIVQGGLLRSFNLLIDFLESVALEDYSDCEKKSDLCAAANQLRDVLVKNHQDFSELQEITVQKINTFVRNIYVALSEVEAKYNQVKNEEALPQLAAFLDEMNLMLAQFIRYCSFLGDDIFSERKMVANDSLAVKSSERFVSVPVLAFDQLMEDTVAWLQTVKEEEGRIVLVNKATVEKIFAEMYSKFEPESLGYAAHAATTIGGYVSSFFVRRFPRVPSFSEELQAVKENLHDAQTPEEFCRAIAHFLVVERQGSEKFKNDFLSKIIAQFSREFSAEKLPKQMQNNPRLAEYLYAQANRQMQAADIESAVNFLTRKLVALQDLPETVCDEYELVA
ncbi:MAG: hypothetical protein Q8L78_01895 [Coxiellaceae bacterium]|nr:hypothetical protein [Coxiellaceae bacterium]